MNKLEPSRILIIDDEQGICDLIANVAEDIGCVAQSAVEKNDILQKIKNDWDCVFVDLTMPEIDGIEVLRLLSEADSQAQIILISGFSEGVLNSAKKLGEVRGLHVFGALSKPIGIATLEAVILDALEHTRRSSGDIKSTQDFDFNLSEASADYGGVLPYYQPKIDVKTGALAGFEALARWWHPQKGILPPSAFIPQAISNGKIDEITMSMVERIAIDIASWSSTSSPTLVAINVEAESLMDLDFPARIESALGQSNVVPDQLTLEVTENGLCNHVANAMDNLLRFRVKGFKLSIDDFGTGHSTLTQLHNVPFNQLKIDKSFVDGIGLSQQSEAIVQSTIDLAHRLELEVVAEGVETKDQVDFLRNHGCDQLQGYYFGKPMNAADVCLWRRQHADPIITAA